MAAIVGGGRTAKPGEISLAHNGVLFMDEFPEFPRAVLETLRQPIETGEVMIARANAHIKYPCRARARRLWRDYVGHLRLMDRFDLRVDVPPVAFRDLDLPGSGATSRDIATRVAAARAIQTACARYLGELSALLDETARALLTNAADRFGLSARGYHRVLRVARSIADLEATDTITRDHVAEALSYRLPQGTT